MSILSTGIPSLDLVLGGGIQTGSLIIIAGPPGTGKTILAQQICFANATPERKAIYYTTLSEPHSKLIRHLSQFAFFDQDALGKSVELIHLRDPQDDDRTDGFAGEIVRKSFEQEPVAIVVDSARALHDFQDPQMLRAITYDLASRVAHTDAVLILVGEYTEEDVGIAPEFAVADGIIQVANDVQGSVDQRWLRVLKMRGAGHLNGRHTLRIGTNGFEVFPRIESMPAERASVFETRASSGIRGLDEMTGGGFPKGSATLVVGPSGAGKTVVGLHFAVEGVARKEKTAFITFQESERHLYAKARAFGWDLERATRDGMLSIECIQPMEMTLDVIAAQMIAAASNGAQRVVIDSLTELERASKGLGRLAGFLWALIEKFRALGATVLITSETEAFFGPSFELAHGVSFVMDNVVLLRYAELESEIRRALGVVKMRDSDHVKSLVEFEINDKGIQVKGKFAGLSGVLTGTPVRSEERFKEFFGR